MAKLIFIDTETTGLSPENNGIWQIAGIIEINGKVKETFCFEMDPGMVRYDQSAIDKSGKTQDDIMEYDPQDEVFKDFIELLDDYIDRYDKTDKFHFLAYNAKFDMDFTRAWFTKNAHKYFGSYFYSNPIDIYTLVGYVTLGIRDEIPNMKLETMCALFNVELKNAHDADEDIQATYQLFKNIQKDHLKVIL